MIFFTLSFCLRFVSITEVWRCCHGGIWKQMAEMAASYKRHLIDIFLHI